LRLVFTAVRNKKDPKKLTEKGQRLLYRLGSGLWLVLVLVLRCNAIEHIVLRVSTEKLLSTSIQKSVKAVQFVGKICKNTKEKMTTEGRVLLTGNTEINL